MQKHVMNLCSELPNMHITRRPRSQIKRRKRSFEKPEPIPLEKASAFLKQVKGRFKDKPQAYDKFIKVFIDLKRNRIGMVRFLSRVQQLLDGHLDLLRSLNTFLPKDYQIKLPYAYMKRVEFLKKVEMRFADDRQHFLTFIKYLDEYLTVPKDQSMELVTNKIMYLIADHIDLQFEFAAICPQPSWFR